MLTSALTSIDLVNFNARVHALVADGVFEASGRFIPLPPIPQTHGSNRWSACRPGNDGRGCCFRTGEPRSLPAWMNGC